MLIDAQRSKPGNCYDCLFGKHESNKPGKWELAAWERCIDCMLVNDKGNWQAKGAAMVLEEEVL